MQNVYQAPDFRSPELRQTRNLLYGLLVLNFCIYVALIPLDIMSGLFIAYYYLGFPMWYYLIEGPLFVNRTRSQVQGLKIPNFFLFQFLKKILILFTPDQECCQGCCAGCCRGCFNWPTSLTFRIILLLNDFAFFVIYAIKAGNDKKLKDRYCGGSRGYYDCAWYTEYFSYSMASTMLFLAAFGIDIAIIVAFSKFPKNGCCCDNAPQTVIVGGQVQPMQTVQRMPNGQVMMMQNPNVGIQNPNYVIAQQPQSIQVPVQVVQQPQSIQTPVQMVQQPAVIQQDPKQNDSLPSYENP